MSSIKKNFIWNSSYQVLRVATPLLTTPYLARVLGSEQMGVYSYTYAIAYYAQLFCIMGLNQYGTREIAKARGGRDGLSRTFWGIWAMQACIGVAVIIIYVFCALMFAGDFAGISLIWLFWVVGETLDVGWLFFGLEEFRAITIRNVLVRVALVAGIFLLVHSPRDLWIYCLLQALSFFISAVALWPMLRGKIDIYRPSSQEVLSHLKPNLVLFAPVIAASCYLQLNKVVLGAVSTMDQVAYFDNADKISTIPLAVVQSLGTVMLPRMSSLRARGEIGSAASYLGESVLLASMMAFGFAAGIVAIAPEFVPLFFGPGYEPVEMLMPLLSAILPIVAWSNVLGVQWLLPSGRDKQYLASVVAGAVVDVVLCVFLIGRLYALGAALATIIAELTVTVTQVVLLHKELPLTRYACRVLPFVVFSALMIAAVRGVSNILHQDIAGLAIEILLGGGFYALLCIGWFVFKRDSRTI